MFARRSLLLVALVVFLPGCGLIDALMNDPGDPDADAGFDADAGLDADAGQTDAGDAVDNACGGDEELYFEGEPGEPGDSCGACNDGVLVCDGVDALRCVQATAANACEFLPGVEGQGCGPCDTGTWSCTDDGSMECVGAGEYNACGGCGTLEGTPLHVCDADGSGEGVWGCTGPNEVRCVPPHENPCGGPAGALEHDPGTPCGTCGSGTWACGEGDDVVVCENQDFGVNVCGGCEPLPDVIGDECGRCQGEWACETEDTVFCDEPELNACGGCSDLGDVGPGELCADNVVYVCQDLETLTCPDVATNACGGTATLDDLPGEPCGPCDDGAFVCTSSNSVTCMGENETNACGGCSPLADQPGVTCAPGRVWTCDGEDDLRCEPEQGYVAELALLVTIQPPGLLTAGTPFDLAVAIIDQHQQPVEMADVEITLTLNQHEFASGGQQVDASTDPTGVAHFSPVIERAATNFVLDVTADGEEFDEVSTTTQVFNVVADDPSSDHSSITGEAGVVADGQEEALITIELRDEYENPVAGITPQFSASGEGNDYGACTETNADGISTCTMTSTEPGEKTLQILSPVEVVGDTIKFLLSCDSAGAPFGGGTGDPDDPYRICAPHHLNSIGVGTQYLDDSFVVTRDIDMSGIVDFQTIGHVTNAESENKEYWFSGTFDGGGWTISNLTLELDGEDYDTSSDEPHCIGLFGCIDDEGVVENVVLHDIDVNVTELFGYTGGLAGTNLGTIFDSEVSGQFDGEPDAIGCLVGFNNGDITASQASCDITGNSRVGGLVGDNSHQGTITASQSSCDIDGQSSIGGLVGDNFGIISDSHASCDVFGTHAGIGGLVGISEQGTISNSHASGEVIGRGMYVGGFVGLNGATISDSHASGSVTGMWMKVGGFVGENFGSISNCYTSSEVDDGVSDVDPTNVLLMLSRSGSMAWTQGEWGSGDMSNWQIAVNAIDNVVAAFEQELRFGLGYFSGTDVDVPVNCNYNNHSAIMNSLTSNSPGGGSPMASAMNAIADSACMNDSNYASRGILITDGLSSQSQSQVIDATCNARYQGHLISIVGLGGGTDTDFNNILAAAAGTGSCHDDSGNPVDPCQQSVSSSNCTGSYSAMNQTELQNLLLAGFVYEHGGFVGRNDGDITSSYSIGDVEHIRDPEDWWLARSWVGGFAGYNLGEISASYSTGNVDGVINDGAIGGFAGYNRDDISYSYSTGVVTGSGTDNVGGFAGENDEEASGDGDTITACYWDEDTSELSTSDGGEPLGTDDFSQESNFEEWDFTETWTIGAAPDGEERPILLWQDD